MRFGSTVGGTRFPAAGSFGDASYRALLLQDCGSLVPEYALKWPSMQYGSARQGYDFSGADDVMSFARDNGKAVRGHTLLWLQHDGLPGWMSTYDFGSNPRAGAERLIIDHITRVVGRYGSQIRSWDVVNEAIDHNTGALIQTPLSRAMGSPEAVIDLAFRVARSVAPAGTQLVYNDFVSWEYGHTAHRSGALALLRGMRQRGVPIDALGLQSHLGIYWVDPSTGVVSREEGPWRAFLDSVAGLGLDFLITEFDVNDQALAADIGLRDAAVAEYTRAYLDLMFSYRQTREMLVWGMVDRYSWLQTYAPRPDKAAKRPNTHDDNYASKPMRDAIAKAFAATSIRAARPA
nr:endo-1,4-beta-xylanase [Sphingomonas bacterium]